jgi:hypothetical protein
LPQALSLEPLLPPPAPRVAPETEWSEPTSPEPAHAPRRSGAGARIPAEHPPVRPRSFRAAPFADEDTAAPRRRLPIVPLLGGAAVLAVAAIAAVLLMGKRGGTAATAAPPAESTVTTTPAAPAAPAAAPTAVPTAVPTAAAAPAIGWVRMRGDFPDDAIFWLDSNRMRGRLFQATAGEHNLEVETGEFEPWETTIRVRAGDTLRVNVELIL